MIFQKKDVDFAIDYVHALNIPADFGISDECEDENVVCLCDELSNKSGLCPRLYHGVSKVVLDFEELPFVIKIPLNGMWYYDYDKDDGESEIFREFYRASDLYPDDYCWDEYQKTGLMEIEGFGALAPKMEMLCTIKGRNIYIQEKVTPADRTCEFSPTLESLNISRNLPREYKICDEEWRAAVIEAYGVDFWVRFCKWDEDYCYDILADMHMDNYGWSSDGRPVIFDLSGFRD